MGKCGPPQNQTMRAIQICTFEPLCQKFVGTFVKFWHFFVMPAHQIWSYHVTQEANFEKFLCFPNSAFNIRKSYKISGRKALYFRSYQPKPHGGGGGGGRWKTPSSTFRVKADFVADLVAAMLEATNTKKILDLLRPITRQPLVQMT